MLRNTDNVLCDVIGCYGYDINTAGGAVLVVKDKDAVLDWYSL